MRYSLVESRRRTCATTSRPSATCSKAAGTARIAHLVYASRSSVYGANHTLPFSEDQSVDHPVSLYAATKKANELMAHSYSHLYAAADDRAALLHRLRAVGPARTWRRCCSPGRSSPGEPIHVFNDGRMRRDFTYVDDIVEGVVRVLRPPAGDATGAPYAIYNIGNHEAVELETFIATLERLLGRPAEQGLPADAAGRRAGDLRVDRPAARAAPASRRARRSPTASRASSPGIATIYRATPRADACRAGARRCGRSLDGKMPLAARPPFRRTARTEPHECSMILVTGGAGFIGANFVLDWLAAAGEPVVNLDKLTYAGNLGNLAALERRRRGTCSSAATSATARWSPRCSREHRPRAIVNFAAESHVDRSIHGPAAFIADQRRRHVHAARRDARAAGRRCRAAERERVPLPARVDRRGLRLARARPIRAFTETTPYAPNSPYSASKAASDHLVRAYHHTYGLPTLTTNCSNNYGPRQFPEKLIPLMIVNALAGKPLPVYGDGQQRARLALRRRPLRGDPHACSTRGRPGETYNIGGNAEMTNLDVVRTLCRHARTSCAPGPRLRDR